MSKPLQAAALTGCLKLPKMTYHLKGVISPADRQEKGGHKTHRIWLDGIELLPEMGHILRPFYECKFDWGRHSNSGSFTAALSVCLCLFREERLAENVFTCFEQEFLAEFPSRNFDRIINLEPFLHQYTERLQPDVCSRFCAVSLINNREVLLRIDPVTGLISADLSENYAMHNKRIPDQLLLRWSERKRKLLMRLFGEHTYVVKGNDMDDVMRHVEEILGRFYFKSLTRMIKNSKPDLF